VKYTSLKGIEGEGRTCATPVVRGKKRSERVTVDGVSMYWGSGGGGGIRLERKKRSKCSLPFVHREGLGTKKNHGE